MSRNTDKDVEVDCLTSGCPVCGSHGNHTHTEDEWYGR
jgi:hypothetical protein